MGVAVTLKTKMATSSASPPGGGVPWVFFGRDVPLGLVVGEMVK